VNALMRQKLARTSAAPGKTRQANIFQMTVSGGLGHPGTWSAYLVDLPGYGYARGGPESVTELAAVVEAYFAAGRRPVAEGPGRGTSRRGGVFLLLDSRHPGLVSNIEAYQWIVTNIEVPHVIATKVDKLSRAERTRHLRAFADAFGQTPLALSSVTGEGLDDLRRLMAKLAKGVAPA